jgi:hypothetical protein
VTDIEKSQGHRVSPAMAGGAGQGRKNKKFPQRSN